MAEPSSLVRRRALLCCGGAAMFSALLAPAARAQTLAEGFVNPCLHGLPADLAQHPLVRQAWQGIDATRLVDVHAHLLGTGDSGSGCSVHPSMYSLLSPGEVLRRRAILNAACVDGDALSVDRAYLERLRALVTAFPAGPRWWLYAFDRAHDDDGREQPDWTTFHVPDAYAAQVAAAEPERFAWVCSVHPYRTDAVDRLRAARRAGAVACKWLPSAMNIALDNPRCRPFYAELAATGMPLVVHCGEEKAVPGARRHAFGNPLLVRHPLAQGVRVVMAHAASLGHAVDTDQRSNPRVWAFDLFARLMDEPDAKQRLLADLSALFQANRRPAVWRTVLERNDWHARLLHGSDYPLPGLMPLFDLRALVAEGLLAEEAVAPLRAIRRHNVLLFDFVLKRSLRAGAAALPATVFEGRALSAHAGPAATLPGSAPNNHQHTVPGGGTS